MRGLGEGIAFFGFCVGAAMVEMSGESATGLWTVIIIWLVWSDWGQK